MEQVSMFHRHAFLVSHFTLTANINVNKMTPHPTDRKFTLGIPTTRRQRNDPTPPIWP